MSSTRKTSSSSSSSKTSKHAGSLMFFKVFLPDRSSQKLELPSAFVKQLKGNLPSTSLVCSGNRTWSVNVKKAGNCSYFEKGWSDFVKDNPLEAGDFLVFNFLDKSRFSVRIYGKNSCQKSSLYPLNEIKVEKEDDQAAADHHREQTNGHEAPHHHREQTNGHKEDTSNLAGHEELSYEDSNVYNHPKQTNGQRVSHHHREKRNGHEVSHHHREQTNGREVSHHYREQTNGREVSHHHRKQTNGREVPHHHHREQTNGHEVPHHHREQTNGHEVPHHHEQTNGPEVPRHHEQTNGPEVPHHHEQTNGHEVPKHHHEQANGHGDDMNNLAGDEELSSEDSDESWQSEEQLVRRKKDIHVRKRPRHMAKKKEKDPNAASKKEKAPEEPGKSTSKYPQFKLGVLPVYIWHGSLNIPMPFAEKYLKAGKVDATLQVLTKSWRVTLTTYTNGCCKMSSGWLAFVRDNSIQEGDICLFELIDPINYIFRVSISPMQ